MRVRGRYLLALLLLLLPGCGRRQTALDGRPIVRVGSKAFTESATLGEALTYLASSGGADATHRARLGDTSKVWTGLLVGDLDAYCEYTGTLTEEILAGEGVRDEAGLRAALARRGLKMSKPLGFNNTYALGMKRARADELGVHSIADLAQPRFQQDPKALRMAFTSAFLHRPDGWEGLRADYGLPQPTPPSVEHTLAYRSLQSGDIDVTDLFSTDAKIRTLDLVVLRDDKHHFPEYAAVIVYRADLEERAPRVVESMLRLEGQVSDATMIELNERAEEQHVPETQVAADLLRDRLGLHVTVVKESLFSRLLARTGEHLLLVSVSLTGAILLAVPLGVVAARRPRLGQVILAASGALQTIPGLALLALLVLLLKQLGAVPMIVALVAYGLLPIVRNTYTGLSDIPISLRESAEALGLSSWARLRLVELPLAMRSILAGIKTAAVINVGYATLGGLVGAGGYGRPIMTGLDKLDTWLILEGAIPAVVLALLVSGLFDLAERVLVSKGLRLRTAAE